MGTKFNHMQRYEKVVTNDGAAHASGDVIGGLLTLPVCTPGNGFTLRELRLVDGANNSSVLTIYVFNAEPTSVADNDVFATAMTIADLKKLKRIISVAAADWVSIHSLTWLVKTDLNIEFPDCNGNIYLYIVGGATLTFGAATLTAHAQGWED